MNLDRQTGKQRGIAYSHFVQGEILVAQGKLDEARSAHEEALKIRTQMGEKTTTEESRLALAILSVEAGHPDEAKQTAREIRDQAHAEKEPQIEIEAEVVLARSLLALGKPADALIEIDNAERLSRSGDRLEQLEVGILAARVHAAGKPTQDQTKQLSALIAHSKTYGCVSCELEARLAFGEIELHSEHKSAGRTLLAQLEKDSAAMGFNLISRKAHTAAAIN